MFRRLVRATRAGKAVHSTATQLHKPVIPAFSRTNKWCPAIPSGVCPSPQLPEVQPKAARQSSQVEAQGRQGTSAKTYTLYPARCSPTSASPGLQTPTKCEFGSNTRRPCTPCPRAYRPAHMCSCGLLGKDLQRITCNTPKMAPCRQQQRNSRGGGHHVRDAVQHWECRRQVATCLLCCQLDVHAGGLSYGPRGQVPREACTSRGK